MEISRIEIPIDAQIRVRQVKEDGQLHLEFQNFQAKGKPNNQASWSGKIQLVLRDSFVREACCLTIIKSGEK